MCSIAQNVGALSPFVKDYSLKIMAIHQGDSVSNFLLGNKGSSGKCVCYQLSLVLIEKLYHNGILSCGKCVVNA